MAAVTRLGLYGAARGPYGSFAGKTAYVPPASKPYTSTFTRLALHGGARPPYASFAGKSATVEVAKPQTGGRSRRKGRRYILEIDGQYFDVNSIAEAEAILSQIRELADESAERDVQTSVTPKPPKVTVKTVQGKPTTSKVLAEAVKRTQRVVNRAYIEAAKRRAVDEEISKLLRGKIEAEEIDEEEALIALLM